MDTAKLIAEAYRWQRRLGNLCLQAAYCHIVANPEHPEVWDANHIDDVTAETDQEIAEVFRLMELHFGYTPWRVVHTDVFTPDVFTARLALHDFQEQPATIQMALQGAVAVRGPSVVLRPVVNDADWADLHRLVAADHAEGRRTADLHASGAFTTAVLSGYRAKGDLHPFNLVLEGGAPIAYGAYAISPNGVGMIEDLFTLKPARRRGVATAMIAAFCDQLHASGCRTIFLGAHASEQPKHLYARLGFRPVGLARTWVATINVRSRSDVRSGSAPG